MARPKKIQTSNEESFRRLLNFLDPDAERAGTRYERLRQKLIRYFERRGCWQADLVADRTFSRAEDVLSRGTPEGPPEGRDGFIVEVGRRVLSEWRDEANRRGALSAPPIETPGVVAVSWHEQIYELCKNRLADRDRFLFDSYFRAVGNDEGKLKDIRLQIAAREGITLDALRVRIHTIKTKLEANCLCCAKCLGV